MVNLTDLNTLYYDNSHPPNVTLSRITILKAQQSQSYPSPPLSVLEDFNSGSSLSGVPPFMYMPMAILHTKVRFPLMSQTTCAWCLPPDFFTRWEIIIFIDLDTTTQL